MTEALSDEEITNIRKRHRETQEYYEQLKRDSGEPLSATGPQVHQDRGTLLSTIASDRAEIARLKGNQRTPGCVEVCERKWRKECDWDCPCPHLKALRAPVEGGQNG